VQSHFLSANLGEARRNSLDVLCRVVKAQCDLRIVPATRPALMSVWQVVAHTRRRAFIRDTAKGAT
jgi:hypothetical protein